MASLDDILTAQKNGVVAINSVAQSNLRSEGNATSATVTANTLVVTGNGYLVRYCVLVAGSAAGTINNANSITNASASNALCATTNTVGVYNVGTVFTNGLVIKPGSGQSINVTYYVQT
jgi:hypothetical protein